MRIRSLLVTVAIAALTLVPGSARATLACGTSLSIATTPDLGTTEASFSSVTAFSGTDAWAVGQRGAGPTAFLAEHWNGAGWSVDSPTAIGTTDDKLLAIDGDTTTDVWAVGVTNTSGGLYSPVAERWTGTGWVSHPPALVGDYTTWLQAVAVVSSTDVWAAGSTQSLADGRLPHPVIEHWNGTGWKVVPVPDVMSNNTGGFDAAGTDAAGDVWFTGWQGGLLNKSGLIARWNGSAIKVVSSPQPQGGPGSATLDGVDVASAHHVWAVGKYHPQNGADRTEVLRKLSKGFKLIPSPNRGTNGSALTDVDSVSTTEAWAAGYHSTSTGTAALVEHWNGSGWSLVSNPAGLPNKSWLAGVATTPAGDVFAAGWQRSSGIERPLIVQRCPS